MRARLTAFGRADDIGHGFLLPPGGEDDEAEIILGLQMALFCGAAIPAFGLRQIDGHAAPELVRLPQIELRIGIAGERQRPPFGHRLREIASLPRIDAILDIGMGGHRERKGRSDRKREAQRGAK